MKCRITLAEGAVLPVYQTEGSSGADVKAFLKTPITLDPGEYKAIPTGIYLEIPPGYEVQVRPRSGLAVKYGVTVLNSPGTLDCDYRGEVKVILINHSKRAFEVKNGDRIAQLVFSPVTLCEFEISETLSSTKRGEGGFGSTGVR